jgi:hypothetical protein
MQRSAYSLDRAPARAAPKLHLGPKAWMARVMCVLSRVCTAAEGLMHRRPSALAEDDERHGEARGPRGGRGC